MDKNHNWYSSNKILIKKKITEDMKLVINPDYASMKEFIGNFPELFAAGEGEIVDSRRNVIRLFNTQMGDWIAKQYKKPVFIQRFIYSFFRKTKASRAFEYSLRLRNLGINCPEPIAYIEEKKVLFTYGYFIYLKCNDPFVYPQLVEKKDYDRDLASAVAGYLAEIHAKGVIHGDMNLTNILYRKDDDHYDFTVIDVNRCKFKRELTKADCYKDLRRVSHRRDLYEYIIAKYASLRGWSAGKAVDKALKYLDEFEAKESFKGAWKNMKKKRQNKD